MVHRRQRLADERLVLECRAGSREAFDRCCSSARSWTSRTIDDLSRISGGGLGLDISREPCQVLGYELSIERQEGEGSRFSVHLDAAAPDPQPGGRAAPEVTNAPGCGRRPAGARPARIP